MRSGSVPAAPRGPSSTCRLYSLHNHSDVRLFASRFDPDWPPTNLPLRPFANASSTTFKTGWIIPPSHENPMDVWKWLIWLRLKCARNLRWSDCERLQTLTMRFQFCQTKEEGRMWIWYHALHCNNGWGKDRYTQHLSKKNICVQRQTLCPVNHRIVENPVKHRIPSLHSFRATNSLLCPGKRSKDRYTRSLLTLY